MGTKKKILVALVLIVAVNVGLFAKRLIQQREWTARITNDRAAETKSLAEGYRLAPTFTMREPSALIGGLAKNRQSKEVLPLAANQVSALGKLDNLLWEARTNSWHNDANYMDDNPADYREYASRNDERRSASSRHAEQMASLGLLTKPQSELVLQQHLTKQRQTLSLGDENVRKLLGWTKQQQAKLEQVWESSRARESKISLVSFDPKTQNQAALDYSANIKATDAATESILTPAQRAMWSQLTASRTLPTDPPQMPQLAEADAARFNIADLSPLFASLDKTESSLKLSAEQKRLLKGLDDVTRQGLFWISKRDDGAATRKEFVKHAEQFLLLGILSEHQAEQLEATVSKT